MSTRGLRGATTVERDDPDLITSATGELLSTMMTTNRIQPAEVISAIFTMTSDLKSAFPARAAREMGWMDVPLLCTVEIPVAGALARCIRVLLHVETSRPRADLEHVYLREARSLRPDLISGEPPPP